MPSVVSMSPAALVLLTGFATSMSLIAAIGAQNPIVLRQGRRGEADLPVDAVWPASHLVLVAAGIAGVGALVSAQPRLVDIATCGGAAYLLVYVLLAARRAMNPGALTPADARPAR